MGHHCACRPSKRESNRSVSTEASNGVVSLAPVGRLLPSKPAVGADRRATSSLRPSGGGRRPLNRGALSVTQMHPASWRTRESLRMFFIGLTTVIVFISGKLWPRYESTHLDREPARSRISHAERSGAQPVDA